MILTKYVEIKITGHTLEHYLSLGYNCKKSDIITVPIEHLSDGCTSEIEIKCDYCGKIYKTKYINISKKDKNDICCSDGSCQQQKRAKSYLEKHGVDNPMKVKSIRQKATDTCMGKYGVSNPLYVDKFQDKIKKTNFERYGNEIAVTSDIVREKIKQTSMDRYGTENPLQSEYAKQRDRDAVMEKYGVTSSFLIPSVQEKLVSVSKDGSKQQKYIRCLYNGELNFRVGMYISDILLENNVICEVDGGGHCLKIKLGQESEEIFYKKEHGREKFLNNSGYKIFRIITDKSTLPSDDFLLSIKDTAYEIFSNGYNIYKYNLDTNENYYE